MFLVKYLILFYAFILAPLPLSMYRHISLSKLHTPYVDMKYEMKYGYDVIIIISATLCSEDITNNPFIGCFCKINKI